MDTGIGHSTARSMTLRYTLALSVIALCTLAAFLMTEGVIGRHQGTLEVVNISGRQRMLSQRTALLVTLLRQPTAEDTRAALLDELRSATATFETAHHRLTGAGPEPPPGSAVRDLYFAGPDPLNALVLRYIAALRAVIDATAGTGLATAMPEAVYVTEQALGPLLLRLEDMVARYQENGEAGFRNLRDLGLAALVVTLLTLCAEAAVIFRPMVRHVRRQFAEIARMATSLEQANEHLEAQVRERTSELRTAKEAAEQAHRAKSRFLAQASHDLKQPLEAVGMFTGILERTVEQPRALALLKDLRGAQRSMRDLLNSILELSRLESGVVRPKPADVGIGPILDQLAAEFAGLAAEKGLRLSAPSCTAVIRTDPFLLERILRNFLSNAIRYTERGGVLVGARRKGGILWIEVHDTGRGIPESDRARIFEEFIQLDRPDRDRSEGIGLGLAIADRLARLLCHPLTVRTRAGGGSVFAVGLPVINRTRPCCPVEDHHRSGDSGMTDNHRDSAKDDRAMPNRARTGVKPEVPDMPRQDEAAPGTPGSGENIDPKTGHRFVEGIGGG